MLDLDDVFSLADDQKRDGVQVSPLDNSINEMWTLKSIEDHNTYQFKYFLGKMYYDIIGTGFASLYLISAKLVSMLIDEHITGFGTKPTVIYGKGSKAIDSYSLLKVIGKSGPIDRGRSPSFMKVTPSGKELMHWKGYYFNESSWDGRDMFSPEGSLHIFVTRKVKEAMEKAGITNVDFTRITEIERLYP
jgi:hypothetical protein